MSLRTRAVLVALAASMSATDVALGQEKRKPAPNQTCGMTTERPPPKPMTPEDSLRHAELRAFRSEVAGLLGTEPIGPGYLVLEVDRETGRQRFEVIDLKLDDEMHAAVKKLLAGHAAQTGRSILLEVPLRDLLSSLDSVPLPYEWCMPLLRNRPAVDARLQRVRDKFSKQTQALQTRQLETRLRLFVTERGDVILREIDKSSGDRAYDLSIYRAAEGMVFHPALLNGVPRAVWVGLPVITNVRGRLVHE